MTNRSLQALFLIGSMVLVPSVVGATTVPAMTGLPPDSGVSGESRFGGEVGFSFTTTAPVQVTALGNLDLSFLSIPAVPKGFEQNVTVALYNLSTSTELGRVVLPAGMSGTLIDNFRYLDLAAPVTLNPGSTYEVLALDQLPLMMFSGDGEQVAVPFTADPRFANITFQAINGNPGQPIVDIFPFNSPIGVSVFGPNLLVTSVPEPATWGLLLFGGGILLCRRRRW